MGRQRLSEPDPNTFAGLVAINVRRLRERRKLKVAEAAEQAELQVSTWYSIESGENATTCGQRFDVLVRFFECKPTDLVKPPKA